MMDEAGNAWNPKSRRREGSSGILRESPGDGPGVLGRYVAPGPLLAMQGVEEGREEGRKERRPMTPEELKQRRELLGMTQDELVPTEKSISLSFQTLTDI